MAVELTVVDAFTRHPFSGNPAAVCVLDRPAPASWMQAVAAEMNLAETAFVVPRGPKPPEPTLAEHDLRWFTPTTEVDLCGHATLASAHVLGGGRFHTRSGVLTCRTVPASDGPGPGAAGVVEPGAAGVVEPGAAGVVEPGAAGVVEMDFPARPAAPCSPPPGLVEALRLDRAGTDERAIEAVLASGRAADGGDVVVVLRSAAAVRALDPDIVGLAEVDARAVVVTGPGDRAGVDCVSRVFGPRVGIPEDPVTGSAHCTLGPWWSARLGRSRLVGEQASRRGGVVRMRLEGDRVLLGGEAVTVAVVRLLVDPPPPGAGRRPDPSI